MSDIYTYISMLKRVYGKGTNDHIIHNDNPDYKEILLKDIIEDKDKWNGCKALDFGCGRGRNIAVLSQLADWKLLVGIDISARNINRCNERSPDISVPTEFYVNNGEDLSCLEDNFFDFVISTIVFQHLCVYELRIKLKKEIYRVMKPNGIFSFQMGFDEKHDNYKENNYKANYSNGVHDVHITNADDLIRDLEDIGFQDITWVIKPSFRDSKHPQWIYVRCCK